jgi:hypothetical protein
MVKNTCRHRNPLTANEVNSIYPRDLGQGGDVGFLWVPVKFPIGFQSIPQVPNVFPSMFLTLSHVLCPKFYSCNLYNQPNNTFILGLSKVQMGQSKMLIIKEKKFELQGPCNK